MKITLLDGSALTYDGPKTVKEIASDIAISLGKKCVGALINGKEICSWNSVISKSCKLEIITDRHDLYSVAVNYTGLIATIYALKKLYPNILIAMKSGDTIKDFAITFDNEVNIKKADLVKIEEEANKLITSNPDISYGVYDPKDEFWIDKTKVNPYFKHVVELYNEKFSVPPEIIIDGVRAIASYPMLQEFKILKKIQLNDVTGEYWLGDAKNKMIQKISGIAVTKLEQLEAYNKEKELQKEMDHRNISKQLGIFTIDPIIGQGLPIWLPNGTILKDEIKNYLKEKEWEYDFIQIQTPVIGSDALYRTSGHWDHYRDDMFPVMSGDDGEQFVLKPMSCPHHISVYNYEPRSYRDLPLRYAEHALQHRWESSGSLTGLERVRAMELTDSHIFARHDQIESEFKHCFRLIQDVLKTFDIKIDYLSLSLRDPEDTEKYYQDDAMWDAAEEQLENVLKDLKIEYKTMKGEAAFYGPKLDIQAKTALGHEITVSTIQLDFLLPEKFDLTYVNKKGEKERPVMIHRGLIGTYERFVSVLLEQTKGVLPLWCTPVQIQLIPVNSVEHGEYTRYLAKIFKDHKLRAKIDNTDERLSYKIRAAQMKKIPYQIVVGNKEREDHTITYRVYGSDVQTTVSIVEFLDMLNKKISTKEFGF